MRGKSALLVVDMQNDFCPGGALAVREGDRIVSALNRYIEEFSKAGLPVFASRDWHPAVTKHFKQYGGVWPPHCIQGTRGAEFHPDLKLPPDAEIISKGMDPEADSYSAFQGVNDRGESLAEALKRRGVEHIYVGGLATDYCVKFSSLDALSSGFRVTVLEDAVRGVDLQPGDSERAIEEMKRAGAEVRTGAE